ncbi:hypothetical protein HYC85_022127 [Camellia sinensis]|uniref:Uncharacterized protein n=1 Tax=Camellia sinensis TaxID=4442 RepID=A0A7J7GJW3_CAMSI|nr:hypothetical protein HYC85_022127 [Camellia sinensis]
MTYFKNIVAKPIYSGLCGSKLRRSVHQIHLPRGCAKLTHEDILGRKIDSL